MDVSIQNYLEFLHTEENTSFCGFAFCGNVTSKVIWAMTFKVFWVMTKKDLEFMYTEQNTSWHWLNCFGRSQHQVNVGMQAYPPTMIQEKLEKPLITLWWGLQHQSILREVDSKHSNWVKDGNHRIRNIAIQEWTHIIWTTICACKLTEAYVILDAMILRWKILLLPWSCRHT